MRSDTTAADATRVERAATAVTRHAGSFEHYVATRGDALLRLATALTGNSADAHDVVQDALSRALPRWERITRVDDVDAYVRRMVVNAHVSWWRRFRKRESPVESVVGPDVHEDSAATVVRAGRDADLWRACAALPRDQRVAVVLRYYEELSYAQIAALTGVAEPTARSRVHRGLTVLRTTFAAQRGPMPGGDDD